MILTLALALWVSAVLARQEERSQVGEAEEEEKVVEVLAEDFEEEVVSSSLLHDTTVAASDSFPEMSLYVEAVVERVERAVEVLLPHVPDSPIGELKSQELFPELRDFILGTIRDAYDLVRTAWRDLIRAHSRGNLGSEETLRALQLIRDAQHQGDRYLNTALQELSVTIKAIVMNSIYVVHRSLHLPNDTKEHDIAEAVHSKLPKVAPNFLGNVMAKVLERGSDPSGYKKILTDPLRDLNKAVDEMHSALETAIENGNAEDMAAYWREVVAQSHQRMRDDPLLEEDLEIIYLNETYLTELTLSLMATW
ncbi:hypothetical protein C7M84_024204 [Penaeus vannamei]|uniref:Uncharacterized protein n=1 Tax=Penaeus vannamei TaxID=6689 RepID=A0A423U1Q1_PENVA|nr:hypothetical protein C7M84_024204 [Penaeus vannamei]